MSSVVTEWKFGEFHSVMYCAICPLRDTATS